MSTSSISSSISHIPTTVPSPELSILINMPDKPIAPFNTKLWTRELCEMTKVQKELTERIEKYTNTNVCVNKKHKHYKHITPEQIQNWREELIAVDNIILNIQKTL